MNPKNLEGLLGMKCMDSEQPTTVCDCEGSRWRSLRLSQEEAHSLFPWDRVTHKFSRDQTGDGNGHSGLGRGLVGAAAPWRAGPSAFMCWGCYNKVPRPGWLEQQAFIFLSFWRLPVQDQGTDAFSPDTSLSVVQTAVFLLCPRHSLSSAPAHVLISSYKEPSHTGLVPTLCLHFNLIEGPRFQTQSRSKALVVRTSTYESGGGAHN